jgi:hypothetical protein
MEPRERFNDEEKRTNEGGRREEGEYAQIYDSSPQKHPM